jgi:DNA-binding IclR family transcriptional regulator
MRRPYPEQEALPPRSCRDRKVIDGISISGTAVRVARPKFATLAFLLQQAADEIALRLKGLIA